MKRPRPEQEEGSALTPGLGAGEAASLLPAATSHAAAPLHHHQQDHSHGLRQGSTHAQAQQQQREDAGDAGTQSLPSLLPPDAQLAPVAAPAGSRYRQHVKEHSASGAGASMDPTCAGGHERSAGSDDKSKSTPNDSCHDGSNGSQEQVAAYNSSHNTEPRHHMRRPTSQSPPPAMSSGTTQNTALTDPSRQGTQGNGSGTSYSGAGGNGVSIPPELQAKLRKKIRIIQPISSTWEADTLLLATPGNGTSRSSGHRNTGSCHDGPSARPAATEPSAGRPEHHDGKSQGSGGSGQDGGGSGQGGNGSGQGGNGSGQGASGSRGGSGSGSGVGDARMQPPSSNTPPSSAETSPATRDNAPANMEEGGSQGKPSSQVRTAHAPSASPAETANGEYNGDKTTAAAAAAAASYPALPPSAKRLRSSAPHAPLPHFAGGTRLPDQRPTLIPGYPPGWLMAAGRDAAGLARMSPEGLGLSWLLPLPGQEALQHQLLQSRIPPMPGNIPASRAAQAAAGGTAGSPGANGLAVSTDPVPRTALSPSPAPMHPLVLPGSGAATALTDIQGQLGQLYDWYISNRNSYLDQTKSYLAGMDQLLQQQAQQQWVAGSAPIGVTAVNKALQAAMQIIKASTELEGSWRAAPSEAQQPS